MYHHSSPEWKKTQWRILATMKIYKNVKQFNFKNSSLIFHTSLAFVRSWLWTYLIKRTKHSSGWILYIVVKEFLPLFIFFDVFDHMRKRVESSFMEMHQNVHQYKSHAYILILNYCLIWCEKIKTIEVWNNWCEMQYGSVD